MGRDTSALCRMSSQACGRLSARHSGVSTATGHAFENVDQPRLSASSWPGPSACEWSPVAAREFGMRVAEPAGTASAPVNRDASRRRPRPERTIGIIGTRARTGQ